jgi:hypothetical protein
MKERIVIDVTGNEDDGREWVEKTFGIKLGLREHEPILKEFDYGSAVIHIKAGAVWESDPDWKLEHPREKPPKITVPL